VSSKSWIKVIMDLVSHHWDKLVVSFQSVMWSNQIVHHIIKHQRCQVDVVLLPSATLENFDLKSHHCN